MTWPADTGPVDPDVESSAGSQRIVLARDAAVLAAIAAGGALGSEARYGLGLALPHRSGSWPAATFLINVTGCLVIGALMVVLTELTAPHRLGRPLLAGGVPG